tara:strand:- start:1128 stop:1427 length:300 start_codon:yes stop_codon:yes gene_type:complete
MSDFIPIGIEYIEIKNNLAKMELKLLNQHKQFSEDKKPLPKKTEESIKTLRDAQALITRLIDGLDKFWKLQKKLKSKEFSSRITISKLEKEVESYKKFM